MKRNYIAIALCFFVWNIIYGQTAPRIVKPLQVGDTIPLQLSTNLENYRSKILVIDFWSTWCGACIDALPKYNGFQNQFRKDLQILAVTSQTEKEAKRFINNHSRISSLNLSYIFGDSLLSRLFPHRILPHVVIIDRFGKVLAITNGIEITSDKLAVIIKGGTDYSFSLKKDIIDFDSQKPILLSGNGGHDEEYLQRSIITGYLNGIQSTSGYNPNFSKSSQRIYATNLSLVQLYGIALRSNLSAKQVIIESEKLFIFNNKRYLNDPIRNRGFLFCYDLVLPNEGNGFRKMLQDLDQYFGLKGTIKKNTMECLVLIRTDTTKTFITKGGIAKTNYSVEVETTKYQQNLPLRSLVAYLNSKSSLAFIIDETNCKDKIDLLFKNDIINIDQVNRSLAAYGLELKNAVRSVDCIVIEDLKE